MTKTSYGPNGMKKMVINHLDKIFVTSDAATILREVNLDFFLKIFKIKTSFI
jgi:T-complex protein 1 subunit theta